MTARNFEVVKLDEAGAEATAQLLARAFFDYPAWVWFCPDDVRRRELIEHSMRVTVRWGLLMGETYVTRPDGGVAVWMPPGTPDDIDPAGTRTGWNEFVAHAGDDVLGRMELMSGEQQPVRERAAGGRPFWYLPWLGVDPALQRTGAGGTLLRHMFTRLDADGAPCILETEKAQNVPYYERHGFVVAHHAVLPNGGPPYWTMVREPSAP
jgi:ribosomal protein S18 acetylase RimI-like enzyme